MDETAPNAYYVPYRQSCNSAMAMIVRLDPAADPVAVLRPE